MSFLKRLKTFMGKKSKQTVKVSWIGLDNAGKSTIIKRVTQGLFSDDTKRTLGLNVDEFESEGIKFVCWDIGGNTVFRDSLWESYISGSSGIIFVVDSSAPDRFPEAQKELWKYVIENQQVGDIPILILANKQDLPEARSAGEVALALDLHKLTKHSYAIVPTSAAS